MEQNFEMVVKGFRLILDGLGVPLTEHIADTPRRAARAWWYELCVGLTERAPKVATFKSEVSEMVLVRSVPVHSLCAHHLLPFVGEATIGYIPGTGQLLGISKLSRLTNYYARRPQVQEELVEQIADAVAEHVVGETKSVPGVSVGGTVRGGVGVLIRANHFCMELRGVQHRGELVTSALRGVFLEPEVRAEFLQLAGA